MSLSIRPLTASGFAGEVSGVDLTKPLSREQVQAIDDGMDQYGVLVVNEQAGLRTALGLLSPKSSVLLYKGGNMGITIRAVQNGFVGEVTDINICAPLTRDQVAAIERGMDDYAVLTFPDQPLTDQQQMAFTANFGQLEITLAGQMAKPEERRFQTLELGDISNYAKGDTTKLRERADKARMYALANRLWHSDASFRAVGAGYTLLHARIVPSSGADTEFADMRGAYDALTAKEKQEVEDLVCEHSIVYSRQQIGFAEYNPGFEEHLKPVPHKLVLTRPQTGRKSLYLSSHIGGIVGWPVPEARAFLRDLTEHATQAQFVYAHKWKVGDMVMWDNRTVMHRATRFDDLKEVRDLRRTSLKGVGMEVKLQQSVMVATAA